MGRMKCNLMPYRSNMCRNVFVYLAGHHLVARFSRVGKMIPMCIFQITNVGPLLRADSLRGSYMASAPFVPALRSRNERT